MAVAAAVLVLLGATPAAASAAEELPSVTGNDCVPGSPDTVTDVPWAQTWLQPERAWELTDGRGVTVAVVDGGVGTPSSLSGGAVKQSATDCSGHGTFLASLVAGRPVGEAAFSGVAPAATILNVEVATGAYASGPPVAPPDELADGIRAAVSGGAGVVLLGAVSTGPSADLADAVRAAVRANVVVVSGVGTVRGSDSRLAESYPSAYDGVIGVAAMQLTGEVATFSAFSDDVDLAAPGVGVLGAAPKGPGHYVTDGTAVAAAFVAGTVALVRSYRPDLTVADVTERLRLTAAPTAQRAALGYGVVNPAAAVGDELPASAGRTSDAVTTVAVAPDRPPVTDHTAGLIAVAVAGTGLAAAALAAFAGVVVRRGRARRWRAPS
ncbi:hypothetical protein GCM10009539_26120 [Cryptosporangium japonicum]|uniref:Peptidase S8/S53 domain-containing protein n=1 Tax=Cryptosporangium japonicum TaxID=80872 RepID=A0ABN0U5P5_9ACTN